MKGRCIPDWCVPEGKFLDILSLVYLFKLWPGVFPCLPDVEYSLLFMSFLLMCFVSFILIWRQASGNTASGGKGFQDSSCRVSCPNQPEFRSRKERTITENVYAPFCYGVPLTEPVAPGWIGPDGYKELRRSKKFWISPPFNLLCLKFYQQGCIALHDRRLI